MSTPNKRRGSDRSNTSSSNLTSSLDIPSAPYAATPNPPNASSSTPAPNTPQSTGIMDCTSDPIRFTAVQIHTAKCALCDKRNMDMMRRCPGCTYQVCKPCFDARNGAPLVHGNVGSGFSSGLPVTPARRRILNPVSSTGSGIGSAASASGRSAALASARSGYGDYGLSAAIGSDSGAGANAVAGNTTSLQDTKMADAADSTDDAQAPTPTPTSTSGIKHASIKSGKRTRKAKSKAAVRDISSDSDEDEEFMPDLGSPTPTFKSKRRKLTTDGNSGRGERDGPTAMSPLVVSARRSSRAPASNTNTVVVANTRQTANTGQTAISTSSPTATRSRTAGAVTFASTNECVGAEASTQAYGENENIQEVNEGWDDANILDRESGPGTIQALLEAQGVDTPNRRYREHLLHRREPIIENPIINIPPNVASRFKASSAVSNLARIHEEAREKLKQPQKEGASEADPDNAEDPKIQTIRQFVEARIVEAIQSVKLSDVQKPILKDAINVAVMTLLEKFNQALADGVKPYFQYSLDKTMDYIDINEWQRPELEAGVANECAHVLERFKGAVLVMETPPIGSCQVSPSEPRSNVDRGGSSSQYGSASPKAASALDRDMTKQASEQDQEVPRVDANMERDAQPPSSPLAS